VPISQTQKAASQKKFENDNSSAANYKTNLILHSHIELHMKPNNDIPKHTLKKDFDKVNKSNQSLLKFIRGKEHRLDFLILFFSCLAGYVVTKICYPCPSITNDSAAYVHAAKLNQFNYIRPFGYSWLLRNLHSLSPSIDFVVSFQFFLYLISVTFFSFTLKFFFKPANKHLWLLFLILLISRPVAFFLANSIMTDIMFSSLVYIILSCFIFIIFKKSWIALLVYVTALYLALITRYSALAFPFLFIPSMFFIKGTFRWVTILSTLFIVMIFYSHTKNLMKETTGLDQFSTGFDGWQLASNAMHVIPFANIDSNLIEDNDVRALHSLTLRYKDSIRQITNNGQIVCTSFMWDKTMPLKQFLFYTLSQRHSTNYPAAWIELGSDTYKEYGKFIIFNQPVLFFKYYLLPNFKKVFYPTDTEELLSNPMAEDIKFVAEAYDLSKERVYEKNYPVMNIASRWVEASYLFGWVAVTLVSVFWWSNRKTIKFNKQEGVVFCVLILFALMYYVTTTIASPVALRYWLPVDYFKITFCYLTINKYLQRKTFSYQQVNA
jgi:hypothetical protein